MSTLQRPFNQDHPFRTPTVTLETYIRLIQHHMNNKGSMCVVIPLAYIPHLKSVYYQLRFEKRGDASTGFMRCKLIAMETPTQAQD